MATDIISEKNIYNALVKEGYNMDQAAGIMGNMQNESSFNVESYAIDSNGLPSVGLISWNEGSYPNAGSLVTNNPPKDLKDQMHMLRYGTGGTGPGLQGNSAAEVGGNWAQYVEVCQGCNPGGAQWAQRRANAQQIYSEAKAGKWPTGPGVGTHGGGPGQSTKTTTTSIFSSLSDVNSFFGDLISADFWERAGLIIFGAILIIVGIVILAGPTRTGQAAAIATGNPELAAGLSGMARKAGGPSKQQIQNRTERLRLAERNTAIGERRQALREQKEVRTAGHNERTIRIRESRERRNSLPKPKTHKSGTGEPNPNPQHS